ncbi:hypothetical protein GCM10023116_43580 [Kistimonas scapharcae]|uniref:Uncharacterized protein n=1 Tax=Kistimonas scapharcae TaxID=1036133 RepID=A0ABP8V7X4_9GAMM
MIKKTELGWRLLRLGAKLALSDDKELEKLKHRINQSTMEGSFIDSGGYLHTEIAPISDYEAISVRIALLRMAEVEPVTEKQTYYKEQWK